MGVLDVTTFPFTVPASTAYVILGCAPSSLGGFYKIVNAAGVTISEGGFQLSTDATAYPFGYAYGSQYPFVLVAGDVMTVSGVTAVRLLQVNLPVVGGFLV